jgi:hypothetical protein
MNSRGTPFVYRSSMRSSSRQSEASQTNRLIALVASFMLVAAIGVSFVGNPEVEVSISTTTPEPTESTVPEVENFSDEESTDAGNYEQNFEPGIDPIIGKAFVRDRSLSPATLAYPFNEVGPSRKPPVNKHPFLTGIIDKYVYGQGISRSTFIPQMMEIDQSGLDCYPGFWTSLMACGTASTPRGRFQISFARTMTNSLNWYLSDLIDVNISYESDRGNKKYSISVLQANLSSDKCAAGYQDTVTLDKLRVGNEELFVITTDGYFGTSSNDQVFGINLYVVGMNATGIPEIVASYEAVEPLQIAATDRSLMLTFQTEYQGSTSPGSGLIAEILPQSGNWAERLHPIVDKKDPLWKFMTSPYGDKNKTPGLGLPLRLLDYTSIFYQKKWEMKTFCAGREDE